MIRKHRVHIQDSANFTDYTLYYTAGTVAGIVHREHYSSEPQMSTCRILSVFRQLVQGEELAITWKPSPMGDYPHTAKVRAEIDRWLMKHEVSK